MLVEELLTLELLQSSYLNISAEDITLVCTGSKHRVNAQRSLTLLDSKCRELGLKLNLAKTKAMSFGGTATTTPLIAAGVQISWVESHQYLGVWLEPSTEALCQQPERKNFHQN